MALIELVREKPLAKPSRREAGLRRQEPAALKRSLQHLQHPLLGRIIECLEGEGGTVLVDVEVRGVPLFQGALNNTVAEEEALAWGLALVDLAAKLLDLPTPMGIEAIPLGWIHRSRSGALILGGMVLRHVSDGDPGERDAAIRRDIEVIGKLLHAFFVGEPWSPAAPRGVLRGTRRTPRLPTWTALLLHRALGGEPPWRSLDEFAAGIEVTLGFARLASHAVAIRGGIG